MQIENQIGATRLLIRTKLIVTLMFAAFASVQSSATYASDTVSYDISKAVLRINGPFNDNGDAVSIRVPMFDGDDKVDVPLTVAQEFAGSFFEVQIGPEFSEIFGRPLPAEMEDFGQSEFTDLDYDYAAFRGACLRSSNGKLAVMIDLKQAGTANAGHPSDTLFIFTGLDETVLYEVINRDDWTDAACLDEARDAAVFATLVRAEQTELVESLAPVPQFDAATTELDVRDLAGDPRDAIKAHFQKFSAYYDPQYCRGKEDFDVQECAKNRSSLARVFDSSDYDIYRARFVQDCASEGIDILHAKQSDTWVSLTNNPSGCSKYYLCEPDYLAIDGHILRANLPSGCIHWGDWMDVTIDLTTFEVRQR